MIVKLNANSFLMTKRHVWLFLDDILSFIRDLMNNYDRFTVKLK